MRLRPTPLGSRRFGRVSGALISISGSSGTRERREPLSSPSPTSRAALRPDGPARAPELHRRTARRLLPFLALASLLFTTCDARLHLYIHGGRETLLPGRAYGDALTVHGIVASVPPGRGLPPGEPPRRFVLRHPLRPPDWNGSLAIGAHRGVGGFRRDADGAELGTGETDLDDLVGWWALDQGFAWASFDRAGLGDEGGALRLTEAFARLMFDQIRPRLASDPDRILLFGYAEGGGIARQAAVSEDGAFAGAVLVSATLGDPDGAERRRAARVALADDRDRTGAGFAAYVEAAGVPADGSRFWPFFDAAARDPRPVLPAPSAELRIPVIEVVGALDDWVLPEVLAYRDRVQAVAAGQFHDLRLVPGAWRADPEDDLVAEFRALASELDLDEADAEALGTGAPLAAEARRALADLQRRLAGETR